ncbi:hypothetical protein ACHAXT_009097 [Thalassiosira profunda]
MHLLRAAAAAAGAFLAVAAPAGVANIGVRDARLGSIRGTAPHQFDFARRLSVPTCDPGTETCCDADDDFCECGPICPTGDDAISIEPEVLDEKCLCGTCVNNTECLNNPFTCNPEDNCLLDETGARTVPIYLSLKPSQGWLDAYAAGPAEVLFKRAKNKACAQDEYVQTGSGLLEVVKRLKGECVDAGGTIIGPDDCGCAVDKVAKDRLQPEPILKIGANYTQTSGDEDYVSPEDGPELLDSDIFLTLKGFCIALSNNPTDLKCSGEVPQIPDDQCPPGGAGTVPPTASPSAPPTTLRESRNSRQSQEANLPYPV